MKEKFLNILFSTRLTALFFILYPTAMAFGTFIESWYSTDTAKILIYNAWWFELIMVFMAINFFGNIFRFLSHLISPCKVLADEIHSHSDSLYGNIVYFNLLNLS